MPVLPQPNRASFHCLTKTLEAYGQAQALSSFTHVDYNEAKRYGQPPDLTSSYPTSALLYIYFLLTGETIKKYGQIHKH
jgi:hypothetical protein